MDFCFQVQTEKQLLFWPRWTRFLLLVEVADVSCNNISTRRRLCLPQAHAQDYDMSIVLGAAAACKPRVVFRARAGATSRALPSTRSPRADPACGTRFSCGKMARTTRGTSRTCAGDSAGETSDDTTPEDDAEKILGDSFVQDEITSQLKYQTKLYQAQQFLEDKKAEFVEKGEEGKSQMEEEAQLARDRASLELGMRASEIDDQLAEMLDETAAARARNEKVQAELAELEEQLTGRSSGRFRKVKNNPISELKQKAIDDEAANVDSKMRNTLEATQRKSAYTLILLLLVVTDISLFAEYAWDKAFAVTAVIGLVGYQAKNENNK
tara:strand:- start:3887 stop:4861 length:975 start_codon:yes stop_codon:yes gene_type:complete